MAKMNYKDYGVNKREWQKLREKIIFHRAQRRCEMCGVSENDEYIWSNFRQVKSAPLTLGFELVQKLPKHVHKAQLQLAHIDDNKMNMDENNLLSLCACCHDLFDRKKQISRQIMIDKNISESDLCCGNITLYIERVNDNEFTYDTSVIYI